MPDAYSYEIREKAEDLYVIDGLTFDQVAAETGVSVTQLKRWSGESKTTWTEARKEYRAALSSIRRDTVLAKAKLIKEVIATLDPQKAYAFSSLISADRAINQAAAQAAAEQPPPAGGELVQIKTPAEAVEALRTAIEKRVNRMLTGGEISLKSIKEIKEALEYWESVRAKHQPEGGGADQTGISDETILKIRRDVLRMAN